MVCVLEGHFMRGKLAEESPLVFTVKLSVHEAFLRDAEISFGRTTRHFVPGYNEWPRWGQENRRSTGPFM